MTLIYDPELKTLRWAPIVLPPLALASTSIPRQPNQKRNINSEIESILRAGRENGADELELELESDILQGIDIGGLEEIFGISVKVGQKQKNYYQIKVRYKD
jgi:hypothetical protein